MGGQCAAICRSLVRSRATSPARASLLDRLRRIHAPEFRLLQPAAVAADVDFAPASLTVQQLAGYSRLDLGEAAGAVARGAAQGAYFADHDDRAFARQHALVDPALGSFPIADSPPCVELRRDLDRNVALHEDPFDRIAGTRARPDIHLRRTQRDESGDRQARRGSHAGNRFGLLGLSGRHAGAGGQQGGQAKSENADTGGNDHGLELWSGKPLGGVIHSMWQRYGRWRLPNL